MAKLLSEITLNDKSPRAISLLSTAISKFELAKMLEKNILAAWVAGSLARHFLYLEPIGRYSDIDMLIVVKDSVENELGEGMCKYLRLRSLKKFKERVEKEKKLVEASLGKIFF